jgi:effector-binding domain-containing protein
MPKFQVERSTVINANPERVFDTIADYRTWTTWSPWLIADPEATVTISEKPAAVGSKYHWKGTVTGEGELVHRQLKRGQIIEDDLTFLKPFKSLAKTAFHVRPEGGGTHLTWSMDSSMPWFMFWMIPMMKTFIGMDYGRGLNMLKEWIELGTIQSKTKVHGVETVQPFRMAGVAASSPIDRIGPSMEQTFSKAQTEFKNLGMPMTGEMISVYTKFRVKEGIFDYISGYVIPESVQAPTGSALVTWQLPTTKAFRVEHIGSYRHLGNGWSVANQIARYKKLKQSSTGTYEIYRTIPPKTPESELVTDIYLPLKK